MNCVSAFRMFPYHVIDAFFPIRYLLFGEGLKGGSFFKCQPAVSWAAGDRRRGIVSCGGWGFLRRGAETGLVTSDCGTNKMTDVQMDQVSPPL